MNKNLYVNKNVVGENTNSVTRNIINIGNILSSKINQAIQQNSQFLNILIPYVTNNQPIPNNLSNIDSNLINEIINNINAIYTSSNVKDPILSSTGNYYTVSDNNIIKNSLSNWPIIFLNIETNKNIIRNSYIEQTNFPINSQQLRIVFSFPRFKKFAIKFLSRLDNAILRSDSKLRIIYYLFYYCFYNILNQEQYAYINFEKTKHEEYNSEFALPYFKIDSEYNFYNEQYEKTFNKNYINLHTLPNYYLLESYLYTNETDRIKNSVSLNSKIQVTEQSVLDNSYYNDYANELPLISQEEINSTLSYTKNYLLNSRYSNYFTTTLSKENFPYFNNIKISNYYSDVYSDFIIKNGLNSLFAYNISNFIFNNKANKNSLYRNGSLIETEFLNYSDICKFITNKTNGNNVIGFYADTPAADFYSLSQISENLFKPNSIFTYINLQNITINFFSSDDLLRYETILSGVSQPATSLGFLIEKTSNDDSYKQNIILSRESNTLEHEILDTQVVYDKQINYNIYSFDLTPRTIYSYKKLKYGLPPAVNREIRDTKDQHNIDIKLNTTQQLLVIKNLIASDTATIIDNPPLTVDVNIVPFYGVNNAMKFLFNTQLGSYEERPIVILPNDKPLFDLVKKKQKTNSKIMFETDDFIKQIQTFRTTNLPSSYQEFSNSLYRVDDLNGVTAISYIENITPNQKYYYIFRSIDVHNNISNPSSVFEVQIVDNNGVVYPIVKTISLQEQKNYDISKSFRKYIHIKPSLFQSEVLLNEDGKTVSYGEKGNLWDQKFKIRVTSKKTGKCFDINMTFSKLENKIE